MLLTSSLEGTGPPPSQKPEQWYQIPSWTLKCIKSSCWNQIGVYSKPRVFCKSNSACFPYLNLTSPSLLPQNPAPNRWRKEERKRKWFSTLLVNLPSPSQLGRFLLLPPCRDLRLSQLPSNPSSLPLQHLSQHAFTLNSMKVHDWNYRLSTNEAWGGTS